MSDFADAWDENPPAEYDTITAQAYAEETLLREFEEAHERWDYVRSIYGKDMNLWPIAALRVYLGDWSIEKLQAIRERGERETGENT